MQKNRSGSAAAEKVMDMESREDGPDAEKPFGQRWGR